MKRVTMVTIVKRFSYYGNQSNYGNHLVTIIAVTMANL